MDRGVEMKRKGLPTLRLEIFLLVFLCVLVSSVGVGFFSIISSVQRSEMIGKEYYERLEQDVKDELMHATQTAVSILERYNAKYEGGELTLKEAQSQAADIVRELRYEGDGGYFWIDTVDGVNLVLLGRDSEGSSRWDATDRQGNKYIQLMIENGLKEGGGYTRLSFPKPNETEELPKMNYTVCFKPWNWVVGTGVWIDDLDEIYAEYVESSNASLAASIQHQVIFLTIMLFIVTAMVLVITTRITKPLRNVTGKIVDLSEKNLKEFADLEEFERKIMPRRNEIGKMARAVRMLHDNLHQTLQDMTQTISDSAEFVSDSSETLSTNVAHSAAASEMVATSITSVASSCQEQDDAVKKGTDTAKRFLEAMDRFSSTLNSAIQQIRSTNEDANRGKLCSQDAIGQMNVIEHSVSQTSVVVEELGEKLKEIGSIVDVISDIAAQTNLLSLNASIEAAHAGEAGKGFAVVAYEIQNLASMSNHSAGRIADLISDIKQQSEEAVHDMRAGMENVERGTVAVSESGQTFEEIAGSIGSIYESANAMDELLLQLKKETDHIASAFEQVDLNSTSILSEVENVAASSEELSASMQEISQTVAQLAKVAYELKTETRQFEF